MKQIEFILHDNTHFPLHQIKISKNNNYTTIEIES